jgi:hypothetical protein
LDVRGEMAAVQGAEQLQKDQLEQKMNELIHCLTSKKSQELWDKMDDDYLQRLMECLLQVYAYKMQSGDPVRENKESITPIPKNTKLSQTEAIIFVDKLLELMEIDLFEVQMFRSFCFNN